MMRLVFLVALLIPTLASADIVPLKYKNAPPGCNWEVMCDAETDTTEACDRNGDNIVRSLGGKYSVSLFSSSTADATTYSCHLYMGDRGFDDGMRTQVTNSAITEDEPWRQHRRASGRCMG